jgi:hypothetical protein
MCTSGSILIRLMGYAKWPICWSAIKMRSSLWVATFVTPIRERNLRRSKPTLRDSRIPFRTYWLFLALPERRSLQA